MNICFVTAPIATEFKDQDEIDSCLLEPAVSGPQLGILSLASVLEKRGDQVGIVELDPAYVDYLHSANGRGSFADVAGRLIAAAAADVYAFGSICSSYPLTIRIAKAVKAIRPKSEILLGGPQATVVDRPTLAAFPFIDFILRGESELTLPCLLDELEGERQLARVPNLSYRSQSGLQRNPTAPVVEDLDSTPLPAYHLIGGLRSETRASLELGRGCPFACTFCSTNDFFRRKFRLRSPERVLSDMRMLSATYGVHEFELVHDMFTIDRRRVVLFCEAMLASGNDFKWSCSARTDCVDEELLALMARAGCAGIFYGVEAGSPRLQKIIDKHLDIERARQVVSETERLGMRGTVSLITGFPEEIEDDLRQTLRMYMFSARHPQCSPQLNILAPLAETPLHTKYREQMTLGELCSEMSQQGVSQDADDMHLIKEHPEIFPNFYLLPTPHLDRSLLLELREFALNAIGHFRWLLCAIDQTSQELYDLFVSWRKHRVGIRPLQNGPELREYYKSPSFRRDFVSFVESSRAAEAKAVRVLLEFEAAWASAACSIEREVTTSEMVPSRGTTNATRIPARAPGVNLMELSFDIQSVIDGLKQGVEPTWESGPHFYVTPESSGALKRLCKISRELGRLLQLCDGHHSVQEIMDALSGEFGEVKKSQREAVVLGLIEAAMEEGLLTVHPGTTLETAVDPVTTSTRTAIESSSRG